MKVAVVDHSYHRLTHSTEMIPAILRRRGMEVDVLWDDSWRGGAAVSLDDLLGAYDAFVFFQTPARSSRPYARTGANITFIPMLDEYPPERLRDRGAFLPRFAGVKFLNFSEALHRAVIACGLRSLAVRYFPDPANFAAEFPDELSGFFWQRRPDRIGWPVVRGLLGDADFESFHMHLAVDPPHAVVRPDAEDAARFRMTFSEWFDDPAEYRRRVAAAQVYFAPRPMEGIGMSFLEAMAMGRCVVAPNAGTMNEYVQHGKNGLLYEIDRPKPLDFSKVRELGREARRTVEQGNAAWVAAEQAVADFVAEPPAKTGLLAKLLRWTGAASVVAFASIASGQQPQSGIASQTEATRRELAPGLGVATAKLVEGSLPHPSWILELDAALGVIGPAVGLAPGAPWGSEPVGEALRRLGAPVGVVLLPEPPADAPPWVQGFFFAEGRLLGWPARGPLLTYSAEGAIQLAEPPPAMEATVELSDGTRVPLASINGAPGDGWSLYTGPFSRTLVPTALFPTGTQFLHLRPDALNTQPERALWDDALPPERRRWRASAPVAFSTLNVGNGEVALAVPPAAAAAPDLQSSLSIHVPLPPEVSLSLFSVEPGPWFSSQGVTLPEDAVRTLLATDGGGSRVWVIETGGGEGRTPPLSDKRLDQTLRELGATRAVAMPLAGPRLSPGEIDGLRTRILRDRRARAILGPVVRPPELAAAGGERLVRLPAQVAGAPNLLQEHSGPQGLVDGRLGHDPTLDRFWAAGPTGDGKPAWVEFRLPQRAAIRAVDFVHAEACGFSPAFNLAAFRLRVRRSASEGWTTVAEVRHDAPVPRERVELPATTGPVDWIRLEAVQPAFQPGCPTVRIGEMVFWGLTEE